MRGLPYSVALPTWYMSWITVSKLREWKVDCIHTFRWVYSHLNKNTTFNMTFWSHLTPGPRPIPANLSGPISLASCRERWMWSPDSHARLVWHQGCRTGSHCDTIASLKRCFGVFGGGIRPKFSPGAPVRWIVTRDSCSQTVFQASKDSVRSEYWAHKFLEKELKKAFFRKAFVYMSLDDNEPGVLV